MFDRRVLLTFIISALGLIFVARIWLNQSEPKPEATTATNHVTVEVHKSGETAVTSQNKSAIASSQPALAIIDPIAEGEKATDYYELVRLLTPDATGGSAAAQYVIARALHYCNVEWRNVFFSSMTDRPRTEEDLRRLRSYQDDRGRMRIDEANQRCHSFTNTDLQNESARWLALAVKASYPPAVFLDANLSLANSFIAKDKAGQEAARQQAIHASMSKDPNILFGMANFVTTGSSASMGPDLRVSAWRLLGCQSGFDCSAGSNVVKSICGNDPQCANNETMIEYLQRTTGAKFGEIQLQASQIKAALDAQDAEAIEKFL